MKKLAIVLGSSVVLAVAVFSTTFVLAGENDMETQEMSVEDCNPETCKKVCKEQCAKHCTAADIKNCQKVCSSKGK
ncbi:MAG: hypothetical protein ACI9J3_003038 [Parvicellaceae bacterium]|jgi:hypothetical protein